MGEQERLAARRRHIAERLFHLAPLVGVRGLTLEGISAEDLSRLELLVQHLDRELADLQRKARDPMRFFR